MVSLLVDGNWNLKRNYFKRRNLISKGENCGGVFGFLDSLRSVVTKLIPDRVVVCWDGFNAGKLRYEIYKPYKADRGKDWYLEKSMLGAGWNGTPEEKEKYDIFFQKNKLKNYLEELFIRQAEVDFIEADDLIASYVLESTSVNEEIIIYSRDNDYLQLISEKISILNPDNFNFLLTHKNFREKKGYILENELLLKCFETDSDNIKGVKGVTRKKLIKFFPDIANKKYLYKDLVDEAYEKQKSNKLKIYESIINASDILYRNAQLMNLKKPFLNEEAKREVKIITHGILSTDRDISNAVTMFMNDGYIQFLPSNEIDYFFSSFYRIMTKEKEYRDVVNNLNI